MVPKPKNRAGQGLRGTLAGYGLAVGVVALAILLRLSLTGFFGHGLTYVMFCPAVMVAAVLGGLGPGLLATGLAAVAAEYWLQDPERQLLIGRTADAVGLSVYCGLGVFMSLVAHFYHKARDKAASLDRQMAERDSAGIRHLNDVLRAMRDISQLCLRERDGQKLMDEACATLVRTRGYRMAWIGQIEPGSARVHPVARAGHHLDYLDVIVVTCDDAPTAQGPTGTALRERKPATIRDTANDPRFAPWREAALSRGYLSVLAVPVFQGERLFGALTVYADFVGAFDAEEMSLLSELADDIGFALRSIEDENERKRVELRVQHLLGVRHAIHEIGQLCLRERGNQTLLNEACAILVRTRGYRMAWIGRVEPGSVRVLPVAGAGHGAQDIGLVVVTYDDTPTGRGAVGTALRERRPVIIHNIDTDPRFAPWREGARTHGFASALAVPLLQGEQVFGALTVYADSTAAFDAEETGLLSDLAGDIAFTVRSIEDENERKRAEAALLDAQFLNQQIITDAPVGIVAVDRNLKVTIWNPQITAITGLPRESVIGKHITEVPPLAPGAEMWKSAEAIWAGETVSLPDLRYEFPDTGRAGWVSVNRSPLRNAKGGIIGIISTIADITQRKQAEEALRRSEEHVREQFAELDQLYRTAPVGLCLLDPQRRYLRINERLAAFIGRPAAELPGQTSYTAIPDIAAFTAPYFRRALETGEPVLNVEVQDPVATDPASARTFLANYHPFKLANGKLLGVSLVIMEITERKRTERQLLDYQQRLRALASELALTEQRERRQLATLLHDTVSQPLALAKIKLGASRSAAPPEQGLLDEVNAALGEAIHYTRSLTFQLSPPILHELGLGPALDWLTEQIAEQHGLGYQFQDDEAPKPLDEDARIVFFSGVRELLFNVVKHAKATHVSVFLRRDGDAICVVVEDNGVGFDSSQQSARPPAAGGFGLFNIRERLGSLGGRCDVHAEPGHGTRVELRLPLTRSGS